ncbi:MAG: hypothetical protein IPG45_25240 [Deltaproteobacteria bacterium]|nr:hypothetical protein [Deltaproteobacteria bacterium]
MKPSLLLSLCSSLLATSAEAETKRAAPPLERPATAAIKRQAPGEACVPTAPEVQVRLHFEGGTLGELSKEIARHTCRNLNLDHRLAHEPIWLASGAGIPAGHLWTTFLDLLASRELSLVSTIHQDTIIRAADAPRSTVPTLAAGQTTPGENRMITKVLRPKTKDLNATSNFLNVFKSSTAQLHAYPPAGILVITDYAPNVARLEWLLAEMDSPSK